MESSEHDRLALEDHLDWLHISDLNPDAYNNKTIGHDAVQKTGIVLVGEAQDPH